MEDHPKTLGEFEVRFSSEGACREYLLQLRWPQGVSCPRCECREVWEPIRGLLVCASCSYHISVTAGTIFERTRKPLTIWFRTMWWVTSQKTGVSALASHRFSVWAAITRPGLGSTSSGGPWSGRDEIAFRARWKWMRPMWAARNLVSEGVVRRERAWS